MAAIGAAPKNLPAYGIGTAAAASGAVFCQWPAYDWKDAAEDAGKP